MLAGHELTIVKSFDEAMEIMKEKIDKEKLQGLLAEAGFSEEPNSEDKKQWKAYQDARDAAWENAIIPLPFEVVLTDMMMPMCHTNLMCELFNPKEEVPYGFVLALKAAERGAKFVAMVTDTNHHNGAMSAALDNLSRPYYEDGCKPNFTINNARVAFLHAPMIAVQGTVCPHCAGKCNCHGKCQGKNGKCYQCRGTKLEAGKNWGRVLKDLTQD